MNRIGRGDKNASAISIPPLRGIEIPLSILLSCASCQKCVFVWSADFINGPVLRSQPRFEQRSVVFQPETCKNPSPICDAASEGRPPVLGPV